jgi:outer membrane immunogenic protein
MKIKGSVALAACAGSAFATDGALAQSQPLSWGPPPGQAWSWTGFYIGGHLGHAWQQNQTGATYLDLPAFTVPVVNDTSASGFMGGGQIGYNWQAGMAVFGIEADISSLSGGRTVSQTALIGGVDNTFTSRNEIEWIGTIRGRAGMTIGGRALLYGTGGFAYGSVSNVNTESSVIAGTSATAREQTTRNGYVLGGGLEYMFSPSWTVRVEGLFVDFGTRAVNPTGTCAGAGTAASCAPVTFSNDATIARAAINFRFPPPAPPPP